MNSKMKLLVRMASADSQSEKEYHEAMNHLVTLERCERLVKRLAVAECYNEISPVAKNCVDAHGKRCLSCQARAALKGKL